MIPYSTTERWTQSAGARSFSRHQKMFASVGYVVAYLTLAWLSNERPALAPGITPWHPQAGLSIAFLLIMGPAWFPVTVVVASLSGLWLTSGSVSQVAVVASAIWVASVYGALAVTLRRWMPARNIDSTVDAAKLAGAAAGWSLVAATGFVCSFVFSGDVLIVDALRGTARYWFADLNGILMVTPLLMLGESRRSAISAKSTHRLEILAPPSLAVILLSVNFVLPADQQLRFLYLLFVPVIWAALRWGWHGALPVVLIIQAALLIAAEAALNTPRFIDTQALLLTLSLTALLLGSVVSERWRSEREVRARDAALAQAMRFAVAGELSSALTHELNQPITAVVSYLNASKIIASTQDSDVALLRATLDKARDEAVRASQVLRKLRDHYIGGPSKIEQIDISGLCAEAVSAFADRLRVSGTRLDLDAPAELPRLEGDKTQFEIVLHNLIANAIDATSQNLSVRLIEMRASVNASQLTLTVEDSGRGISDEVAQQLFEPFTTSKPDGMGLGLAISRSLVRSAGGELACTPGGKLGGARFTVTLPLAVIQGNNST